MVRRSLLIVAAAAALACGAAWAQTQDPVDRALRDTIRRLDLQLELPRGVEPPAPMTFRLPAELVWVALICAATLILYSFRDSIPFWRLRSADGWDLPATELENTALDKPAEVLRGADDLGREGRFVEAMHLLLIQSLTDIRARLGTQFADSLTSREILRGVRLPPQGGTALHAIVAAVELTYFGGRSATASDYAACRANFETLRQTLSGSRPA
jgi:hypothetical protein